MNEELNNLLSLIQTKIADRATPEYSETKVNAEDLAEILEGLRLVLSNSVISITVDTYADMLVEATGNLNKRIKVLIDEDKNMNNTTYDYWSNSSLFWIATNEE
jgi:hypothetical protein